MNDSHQPALLDQAIADLRRAASGSVPPTALVEATLQHLGDLESENRKRNRRSVRLDAGAGAPRWALGHPGLRFAGAAVFLLLFSGFTAGIPLATKYLLVALVLTGVAMGHASDRYFLGDRRRRPLVAVAADFSGPGFVFHQAARLLMVPPMLVSQLIRETTGVTIGGLALYVAGVVLFEGSVRVFGDPHNRATPDWPWRLRPCFRGAGFAVFCAGQMLMALGAALMCFH